jgi:hypothetical protein
MKYRIKKGSNCQLLHLETLRFSHKRIIWWLIYKYNKLFIFLETAMGRTVNAQNYDDSEYVKAIYK